MNNALRFACLPATAVCLGLAVHLSAADTPAAAPATPAAAPAVAPRPTPPPPQLPRALMGVITQDEFNTYVKFQQGLREDPTIKDLNMQIRGKMNEMLALQKQVQQAQQKAVDANPEIKAISDKISKSRQRPPPLPPGLAGAHPVPAPGPAAAAPVSPTPAPK